MSQSMLEEFGVYNVVATPKPTDYTKNISEGTPTLTDGVYYQVWSQADATESEITERINQKWEEIRDHRNTLLKDSDWTVLVDSPLSGSVLENWKTYRQELRDVTSQENPFNILWPNQP
jgi:C4-type Zn-finger protein